LIVLVVDVGNSNIVVGCFKCKDGSSKELLFKERITTNVTATVLEYVVSIKTALEINSVSPEEIDGTIISSVVPQVTVLLTPAMEKLTKKTPMIVNSDLKTGMSILIDNPAQLGADLVCGGVAALRDYELPAIIFDMGTATTASVVDKDGNFRGTMILPGLYISLKALVGSASLLPPISFEKPEKIVGTNTVDSMRSGILYGTVSQLDGLADLIEGEMGCKCTKIATGGLAPKVIPYCRHEIISDDDLVLNGMLYIYLENI
jgi:type III pantothenate kinase